MTIHQLKKSERTASSSFLKQNNNFLQKIWREILQVQSFMHLLKTNIFYSKTINTLPIAGLLALVSGCQTTSRPLNVSTVNKVDLNRFMGKWYVLAHIPTVFEKYATNAVETYKRQKDGSIKILYEFNDRSLIGQKRKIRQTGKVFNKKSNSHWKISLMGLLSFDYLVIYLDEKYETTIITVPDKSYVWLLSRTSKIQAKKYQKLLTFLDKQGFDLRQLRKVPRNI